MKNIFRFVFFCILATACHSKKHTFFMGDNFQCKSLDTASFSQKLDDDWPKRKPSSIVDAIRLLDTLADENFKCIIVNSKDEDLYFSLGLKIRNTWVRQGAESLRTQLFDELRVLNVDYSSGLILDIYRQLLTNRQIDLVKRYYHKENDSTWEKTKKELIKIQSELQ